MRVLSRFLLPMLLLLMLAAGTPPTAFAGDLNTLSQALARHPFKGEEPFKDLPGVKLPQKFDDPPTMVCSSHISNDPLWTNESRKGAYIPRLTRRIYRCDDTESNVTVESTRRPDEIDWAKQKRYYKPWIDDGFDRDR